MYEKYFILLFVACSIEEIDSDKIKMDENLISAVETSMEDDE